MRTFQVAFASQSVKPLPLQAKSACAAAAQLMQAYPDKWQRYPEHTTIIVQEQIDGNLGQPIRLQASDVQSHIKETDIVRPVTPEQIAMFESEEAG